MKLRLLLGVMAATVTPLAADAQTSAKLNPNRLYQEFYAGAPFPDVLPTLTHVAANSAAIGAETARAEAAEASKVGLASPAFTGLPTAPTASPGTNTTQLATTAFVTAAIGGVSGFAPLASPIFTGSPVLPAGATGYTQTTGDTTTKLATDAFVIASADAIGSAAAATSTALQKTANLSDVASASSALANLGGAPLASPAFTGTPTAPTAPPGTSTLQLANTSFVTSAIGALSFAPLASPVFSGAPTVPAPTNANSLDVANTAWVTANFAKLASPVFTGDLTAYSIGATTPGPGAFTGLTTTTFVGSGAAAVITAEPGAGTSPTVSVTGHVLAGTASLTTGSSPSASAIVVEIGVVGITSATHCAFSPGSVAATTADVYSTTGNATLFINAGATPLTASTSYVWNYSCAN